MIFCQAIGWCHLNASEQAAWAQAILSVLAIIFAALMPWWLARIAQKKNDRESIARAKSFAILIAREVGNIAFRLDNFLSYEIRQSTEFDGNAASFAVTITPEFRATFQNLHELGNLAPTSQSLAMRLTLLNDILDNMHAESFSNIPPTLLSQVVTDMQWSLETANHLLEQFGTL